MTTKMQSGVLAILLTAVFSNTCGFAQAGPATTKPTAGEFKIFTGRPRLIIVNGYSTSFHWWAYLQHKL
ncbi:MAG: hypothetical protein JSV03_09220, partial [Planctomycetota bacterium]